VTTSSSDERHCSPPRCPSSALSLPTHPSGELPRLTPCRAHALRLPRACAAGLAPPQATVRRRRPRYPAGRGRSDRAPVRGSARPRVRLPGATLLGRPGQFGRWVKPTPHGVRLKPRPGTVPAGNLFSISFKY
jgi:hypothetical protein